MERIEQMTGGKTPETFCIEINELETPTVAAALKNGQRVEIDHLLYEPGNRLGRLPALPLMLISNGEPFPLPSTNSGLSMGDRLLVCAKEGTVNRLRWVLKNPHILEYSTLSCVAPG